jgi:hypothetical protein
MRRPWILSRVKEHFSRISSMRVRGTEFCVTSGGMWAANPEESRPARDPNGRVVEFDLWSSHPKHRWLWTERAARTGALRSATQNYFDGEIFTYLNPASRTGLRMKGGALATMPPKGPLHSVGFCFLDTYQTSLATVLGGSPKVAVKRLGGEGSNEWLIEARGLPKDLRPRDWNDKNRQRVLVKVWLTVEAEKLRVNRWAAFIPNPTPGKPVPGFGKPLPAFEVHGYLLLFGFVNVYDKEAKKSGFQAPRRVLRGNGNFTWEIIIREMLINPNEAADTFRPAIPAGYSITKPGDDGTAALTVTGGRKGSEQRAEQITAHARQMLASGEQLGAAASRWSDWLWPGAAVAFVLAGVASFLVAKRRMKA